MELGGMWRAAPADDELRRRFAAPDHGDDAWEPIVVPGHWRSAPAFAGSDGPLLYRRPFERTPLAPGRRAWITFDGIFYQGDIWLDGAYLGDSEGYFRPHTYEVSEHLAARTAHLLGVEVTCTPQRDRAAKRNLTGVFQHWDNIDPDWNPGGIWRGVRLEETGPVRIRELRVLCREASATRAVVVFRANLDAGPAVDGSRREVTIRSSIGTTDHELTQPLAAGENHVEWTVTVENPELWWPRALGAQPLLPVVVEAWTPDDTERPSHRRELRTGLRRIDVKRWIFSVNGERLFLKGANHGPTRMAIAEATVEELRRDVRLAVDAGLDLLRLHAHITRPELYDAADEAGLLLWQDLPLQWGYARSVRRQAVNQARSAVAVLGHHPSVAVWCGHNEPMAIDVEPGALFDDKELAKIARKALVAQQLPTWNRSVLDRSVKRALDLADGTRPTIAHSGVMPHLPQLDGTDSHLYFGWYHGNARDLDRFAAAVPRMVRFVSEFGAQAVPDSATSFCEPERWPNLDWERLGRHHALQKRQFDRYVPPADFARFDDWRAATQRYQASLVKYHVETLRRLKYHPAGGFAQFCFADAMPAVSWSVLDHERAPKPGYGALAAACEPVIVVADALPSAPAPGDPLVLDVHVVSDLREPLDGCRVHAELRWVGGEHRWQWAGDVPADGCVRVGTIQSIVPDAPGPLELSLRLEGPIVATNAYATRIEAQGKT